MILLWSSWNRDLRCVRIKRRSELSGYELTGVDCITQRRSRASQTLANFRRNPNKQYHTDDNKRTLLLKFHQFYAKKSQRDTHKSRKQFFSNWKQQKTYLSQPWTFKKKIEEKKFEIFRKFFWWRFPASRIVPKTLSSALCYRKNSGL